MRTSFSPTPVTAAISTRTSRDFDQPPGFSRLPESIRPRCTVIAVTTRRTSSTTTWRSEPTSKPSGVTAERPKVRTCSMPSKAPTHSRRLPALVAPYPTGLFHCHLIRFPPSRHLQSGGARAISCSGRRAAGTARRAPAPFCVGRQGRWAQPSALDAQRECNEPVQEQRGFRGQRPRKPPPSRNSGGVTEKRGRGGAPPEEPSSLSHSERLGRHGSGAYTWIVRPHSAAVGLRGRLSMATP